MRIAITGADGLLGRALTRHFRTVQNAEVHPLSHADLDVTRPEQARAVFGRLRPDALINCAVIISVDRCEANPELAYAVNRDGVKNLLAAAAALDRPPVFVQISSSEVFGRWAQGTYRRDGYGEDDEPRPDSMYQKTKHEAEGVLAAFAGERPDRLKRWYLCRAAWLYGEGRDTFVEQFLRMLKNREAITVAYDQWRSPTWTRDFTAALAGFVSGNYPNGIYHIANEVAPGEATVMDVLGVIREHLGPQPGEIEIRRVPLREFFKIPRAPSNVLINTKLPKLRPWREALREYLNLRYPPV